MFQQQIQIINTFLIVIDALCLLLAGVTAYLAKAWLSDWSWPGDSRIYWASILFIIVVNNYVMGKLDLYGQRKPRSRLRLILFILEALMIDFAFLLAAIFLFKYKLYSRMFMLLFFSFGAVLLIIQRSFSAWYFKNRVGKTFNARRLLIVGDMERGRYISDLMEQQLSWGHVIVGRLSIGDENGEKTDQTLGTLKDLPKILIDRPIDEVVFAMSKKQTFNLKAHLDICHEMGIPVRVLPGLWDPDDPYLSVDQCQGVPFLVIGATNVNANALFYKKIIDIIGGVAGMIILGILYLPVAAAIKLDSPGPVFFRHRRVGQNGRTFCLYKFRTMYEDAEARKAELMAQNEMQGAMFKLKDDPRVTRAGRWLRKTSLDEFPQFINVITGEMSLVGTRPPTPEEVKKYHPCQFRRISSKPGITGLWQISGRNEITDFEEVVALDCQYLEKWRLLEDIKILIKTVFVVLRRKGAY